jgi:hypothetical protein
MKKEEFEQIRQTAKENYDGDVELAIAAHLYTPGVIMKCGGVLPVFADKQKLGLLKGHYTRFENAEKRHGKKSKKAKSKK